MTLTPGPTVDVLEAIGYGPDSEIVQAGEINLLATDAHSNVISKLQRSPVGLPVHTCERWIRLRFTSRESVVGSIRFWIDNQSPNEGWTLFYGVVSDYSKPVTAKSVIAIYPVPSSDPGTPNVLDGFVDQYSPWIVLQAEWVGTADDSFQADTFNYVFGWDET